MLELSEARKADAKELLIIIEALSKENSELSNENAELLNKSQFLEVNNHELSDTNKLLSDENAELLNKSKLLTEEIKALKEQLTLLRAKHFGKSSEKIKKKIEEIEESIEDKEITLGLSTEVEADEKDDKKKGKARRKKLPEHLPKDTVELQPPLICPECKGTEFRKIGDDTSQVLEYVPAYFKIVEYIRPRCACKNCDKIVQAYPPSKGIDKGKAGFGLLAHVLITKLPAAYAAGISLLRTSFVLHLLSPGVQCML